MEGRRMWHSREVFKYLPSSSSSALLLWFVVPLLVLAGFAAFTDSWPGQSASKYFATRLNLPANDSVQTTSPANDSVQTTSSANISVQTISSANISVQTHSTNRANDSVQTQSTNEGTDQHPRNDSKVPPSATSSSKKKKGYLGIVEAGLAQARVAIREAKSGGNAQDGNFVPNGPMYLNATAFHRSYLEMEKRFKVFIYEDGDPPIFHYGTTKNTYAIEGYFIQALETSRFRTADPNKAHVYFLPMSILMITQYVFVRETHEWSGMKQTAFDYVNNVIARKYPYWNRSLGADHSIICCHDWGPEISFAIPYLYKNSIRALCNANTSEKFNPSKDVSIPEILLPRGTTKDLIGGPSPSKRPILVFYAGGIHGPIRPILLQYWENKDEDVQVHQYLPKGVSYFGMMRKSRYCICPSGYEVASPRMVEGLYTGCVPVLIKEGYVIPFSDVLDWTTFSVIIPVKDIPNLKKILMGISQRQYIRMQRRGIQVRRHFEMNYPPKPYDVFHMILHSIWLRRLNIRVYDTLEEA